MCVYVYGYRLPGPYPNLLNILLQLDQISPCARGAARPAFTICLPPCLRSLPALGKVGRSIGRTQNHRDSHYFSKQCSKTIGIYIIYKVRKSYVFHSRTKNCLPGLSKSNYPCQSPPVGHLLTSYSTILTLYIKFQNLRLY